jgi:hypothetical protein
MTIAALRAAATVADVHAATHRRAADLLSIKKISLSR